MKITFSKKIRSMTAKEFEQYFKKSFPALAKDWQDYAPMKVEPPPAPKPKPLEKKD